MRKSLQKHTILPWIIILVVVLLSCICAHVFPALTDTTSTIAPQPTPTQTSMPTSAPTHIPTSTPTRIPKPTPTPTPTRIPKPTSTPTPTRIPKPTSTPTLNEVMKQSSQYDCCSVENNVSDVEANETPDGAILVLVRVDNLAPPQVPLDVGQALIFQYMAAAFTSSYTHKSVTVTVMYRGDPEGVISATQSQETANGTLWDKDNPFLYWDYYDTKEVSPSIQ